jgi:ribosome maturation factor RimP
MITKEQINGILEEKLQGSPLFVVGLNILPGNRIEVFLDGDHGVTIDDCSMVSRFIESQLDREAEDFDLEVSSAGLSRPLTFPRQYRKNTGRGLQLMLSDGQKINGILKMADDMGIELVIPAVKKTRQPEQLIKISYSDIKKALVEISFKK